MGRISMPQGKGSQLHNRREYWKIGREIPDNIDQDRSRDNLTIIDLDIREAYREIFGESLEKYNQKQKRNDRKISDYYDHISKSKNGEKLFYEDVLQWGRKEDFETNPELWETARDALQQYAETFEQRNPNLKLIGAYIHMDEASPHLHLDYVPVAHGYSRGLETRNSLDRAMKEMGYQPDKESRKNNATKLWKEHERAYFGEICRTMGLKVEQERQARGSLSVEEYKEAKEQMVEPLREYAAALKEGGAYTNEQGGQSFIVYNDSITALERSREHLQENLEAYENGGFYYDWEKGKGHSIPEGGIRQLVTDAEAEADRITGEASRQADGIIENANREFESMIERVDAYEGSQRALIDSRLEIYEQEQKNALQGKLEGLEGQLQHTRDVISQNQAILEQQAGAYSTNKQQIEEQGSIISRNADRIEELDAQISAKAAAISGISRSYDRIAARAEDLTLPELKVQNRTVIDQKKTLFQDEIAHKEYFVQIPSSSKEEAQRIQREILDLYTKHSAHETLQDTVEQAERQAQEKLQGAQELIRSAQAVLDGQQQREAELDEYERRLKEKNSQLREENIKLERNRRAFRNGWTDRDGNRHPGLDELRQDYGHTQAELRGLQEQKADTLDRLHDLSEQVDSKLSVIQAELSPDMMHKILSDSVAQNLILDTMNQTCHQLEERGLLNGSAGHAFISLDRKPIIERFKERTQDFLAEVKAHMEKMIEQAFHRSGRSR
jgi:hypothetical protein